LVKRNYLNNRGIDTKLAHLGNDPDQFYGFINPPVVHASTVLYRDYEATQTRKQKYTYPTRGTPTTDALASAIDHLEGSAGTILVPSGLAAVSVPMMAFTKSGDHCLIVDSIYSPTRIFANSILKRFGVEIEYFDPLVGDGFANLLRDNTSMVILEAPGSNTFEMLDVAAIAQASHQTGAVVMMDNTWATPLFFKPLDHSVDISIHALTKYPGGHSDLLLGSASANERCWKQLSNSHYKMGTCAQGDDCYATLRGLHTMGVRLRHHEKSALEIANWLGQQKQVSRILHPALPGDPGHDLWKRDFTGSSGLFSFVLKDADETQMAGFLDSLKLFGLGFSWGGYASLAAGVNTRDRTVAKAPEDGAVIRLHIGLENVVDLQEDIDQALSNCR